MKLKLNKNSSTAIYKQISNQIREQIQDGELRDGLVLWSERKLAESLGVHRNTITKSYQDLKSKGYINSYQGKVYTVTYTDVPGSTFYGNKQWHNGSGSNRSIPWNFLIRDEYLDSNNDFDDIFSRSYSHRGISFAAGLVPPEAYFKSDIREILHELILSDEEDIFGYSHYQGQLSLRKNLCSMLRTKNINASPSEIQVVNETNQAMDYLCKLFLKEGDTVITEEPVSPDIYRPLQFMGVNIVSVSLDDQGIKVNVLEKLIKNHKPKFIIVSSSYHDPTGIIMSLDRRKELLEISHRYMIPVIEDDSASEINFSGKIIPSLKSLDNKNNVIYIYSYALTFTPGFRMACIVSEGEIAKKLGYLHSMNMVNFDSINQSIISKYMEKGFYEKNVGKVNDLYKSKADLMSRLLEEKLSDKLNFSKPRGGVYLWCLLDENINIEKLMKSSLKKDLYLIPGSIFFPNGTSGDNYLRLNYSYPSEDEIRRGVDILADIIG